jgi:hypothetical protein
MESVGGCALYIENGQGSETWVKPMDLPSTSNIVMSPNIML